MALRLTTSSLNQGPPTPVELAAQASRLLAAGDVAGYGKLFERAGEHEDHNLRYHARVLLLEQGLSATARAAAGTAAEIFLAVAAGGVAALEEEPREPTILNYTGVALYELWSLDAAEALFKATLRLTPSKPHVRRNLDEVKRRRRVPQRQQPRLRELHSAVAALGRRGKHAAGKAHPATGLTLSLCMIVRDEEEMLPRCLEAVADVVDEIVIVDTGSSDRTIEIAQSFGARVIEREWTGSFAEPRNVSFDAATGDWLMYLDADEVLVREDAQKLRELTGRTWREAFYLVETNFTGEEGDGTAMTHNALRVFRNRPQYRFEGRLHEQITHQLPGYSPERIEQTQVRVEHYGYLGAVRDAKEKSQRNVELLRAQMAESEPTPFLHFNLGSEHAAAGDGAEALAEFERAWSMIEQEGGDAFKQYGFAPTLMVRLVKALRICGRQLDAIEQADIGLRLFPGFTDLVFEQGAASLALGEEREAIAYYRRCATLGDAPAKYTATLGSGTYLPRLALAEIHLRHNELEPARELLDWCLTEHPDFFGSVLPYASVLLRSGVEPDEVVADVERRVAELTPNVRFMLGTALYENKAAEPAERQYRLILERQPHRSQARVALGEALLSQKRYSEAADEALALPEGDPLEQIACRTALFGRIAAEDFEGAAEAQARAERAGLPSEQLLLFAGWRKLQGGESFDGILPGTAVPLLGVILEALLRVQDFTTFERLLPMLSRSQLPAREQRELLAMIYLRQGYLQSAGEEWMAVCQQEPDVRALVGLAQVAAASGLPEDAGTFAAEALSRDPGHAMAQALFDRYAAAEAA